MWHYENDERLHVEFMQAVSSFIPRMPRTFPNDSDIKLIHTDTHTQQKIKKACNLVHKSICCCIVIMKWFWVNRSYAIMWHTISNFQSYIWDTRQYKLFLRDKESIKPIILLKDWNPPWVFKLFLHSRMDSWTSKVIVRNI